LSENILAIARPYAMVGAENAVGECEETSMAIHEDLQDHGLMCKVVNGDFSLTADPKLWSVRYQKHPAYHKAKIENSTIAFGHIWVEIQGFILDATAAQFGENTFICTPVNDVRYKAICYYNTEKQSWYE
jgi:hypothetical protein